MDDDRELDYPWLVHRDERFTLALVLDVGEVLTRHGCPAPVGAALVELTAGLYRALHPQAPNLIHPAGTQVSRYRWAGPPGVWWPDSRGSTFLARPGLRPYRRCRQSTGVSLGLSVRGVSDLAA